jgi:hypothetical protein
VETLEESKSAKHGILPDVFRVGAARQNSYCQIECRIQMREHQLLESCPIFRIQHIKPFWPFWAFLAISELHQ